MFAETTNSVQNSGDGSGSEGGSLIEEEAEEAEDDGFLEEDDTFGPGLNLFDDDATVFRPAPIVPTPQVEKVR